MGDCSGGHSHAIQYTTDEPHWGGVSGCTFEEAVSWGKVFLNKGDGIIVERPTHLAAIQSFGLFEPRFLSVPLQEDGVEQSHEP